MIKRRLFPQLKAMLSRHPAVGILGPRQVGKRTLAFEISEQIPAIYLDLESPSDKDKLSDPEHYLAQHADKLVIIDEVQRMPELFQPLRGIIDAGRRKGLKHSRFLILGSASLDLLQQSSESLAGRIAYAELTPFNLTEIEDGFAHQQKLWLRGGFPDSYLADDDAGSLEWRQNFIATYLERDIPQFGPRIPAETLRRFWTMLAHYQGTPLNAAQLATNLSISGQYVVRYLDLLVDLLLVRRLRPWSGNSGKRLMKTPKVYVRDSGLVHALLNLESLEELWSHPVVGGSWEGFVIETLLSLLPNRTEAYYYRTSAGAEIDLILEFPKGDRWAIEIKRGLNPKVEKGFHNACLDLEPQRRFIVYSGKERYTLKDNIEAINLLDLAQELSTL